MAVKKSPSKRLRVLVLTREDLVPPENVDGIDLEKVDWRTDYDVIQGLKKLGHEVRVLGVSDDLGKIRTTLHEYDPHITYNLLDDFDNVGVFDSNVVSYLELMKRPYTGCNPRGLMLARDKALSKKLLAYHRINTPKFVVFPRNRNVKRPKHLKFPLFVKSLTEQASLGISQASIVYDDEKLMERVKFIHENVGTDAIAESYIEGRELYVGIIGNFRYEVFAPWELLFKEAPEEIPRIATRNVKWNPNYRNKYNITTDKAQDLSPELTEQIKQVCKRVYRILGLSGYARIDLRLTPKNEIYVLEANPNPDIGAEEDFAESANLSGMKYDELLSRIINLGLRWNPSDMQ